jgi:hypothetical protein
VRTWGACGLPRDPRWRALPLPALCEPALAALSAQGWASTAGLIGDLQTAALVTTDGMVDWFCCPRFDSPSVFASLVDADKGGHFRIAPDRDDFVSRQLYLSGTAILITRFMTPDGVGEVRDFMPVTPGTVLRWQHRLVTRQARASSSRNDLLSN